MIEEKFREFLKEENPKIRKVRFKKWILCNVNFLLRDELVKICLLYTLLIDDDEIMSELLKSYCDSSFKR